MKPWLITPCYLFHPWSLAPWYCIVSSCIVLYIHASGCVLATEVDNEQVYRMAAVMQQCGGLDVMLTRLG